MALPDEFHELAAKVRNWGRWGDDDELGTLNLIDDDARRRGAACVRAGRAIALSLPLQQDGIQLGSIPGRVNPLRTMVALNANYGGPDGVCFNDDVVVMGLQAATHWDALAHVSYGGKLYNGFPAETVTFAGASRCGIDRVPTLVSRGVLLDVARALGVERLAGGHAITADDLDAACELGRITLEPGDVVVVRTGQMSLLGPSTEAKSAYMAPTGGFSMQSALWLRDHDVAAVASDTYVGEVFPGERDDLMLPVHMLHLVDMGLTQGQNWVLNELADDCASDGVYEFLLDASPQPFVSGLGSPVNPVVLK